MTRAKNIRREGVLMIPDLRRGALAKMTSRPRRSAIDSTGTKATMVKSTGYEKIYAVILKVPRGRVATYGQIATLAGMPGHARQVGYALNALPDGSPVPWHRVINASGTISRRSEPISETIQRGLLEQEGIAFNLNGRVDLVRYRWKRTTRTTSRPRARP